MLSRTAAVLTLSLLTIAALFAAEPGTNGVRWEHDLLKARTAAVKSGRPLLIVFGADWCTFCKKMEATTLADPVMAREINATFVPVHLDFDEQRKVAQALEIEAIPCSIVLSVDAEVLARHDGFAKPDEYRKTLARGLRTHRINLASSQGPGPRR